MGIAVGWTRLNSFEIASQSAQTILARGGWLIDAGLVGVRLLGIARAPASFNRLHQLLLGLRHVGRPVGREVLAECLNISRARTASITT